MPATSPSPRPTPKTTRKEPREQVLQGFLRREKERLKAATIEWKVRGCLQLQHYRHLKLTMKTLLVCEECFE
jgi:hypothetical protein